MVCYVLLLQLFLSLKNIPESAYYFDFVFYSLLRSELFFALIFVTVCLVGIVSFRLEGRQFWLLERDRELSYLKPLILIFEVYFSTYD